MRNDQIFEFSVTYACGHIVYVKIVAANEKDACEKFPRNLYRTAQFIEMVSLKF